MEEYSPKASLNIGGRNKSHPINTAALVELRKADAPIPLTAI
jgi:hypothetical protein